MLPFGAQRCGRRLHQRTAASAARWLHPQPRHPAERAYKCTWPGCAFTTATQQNLDTHNNRKHTGERPYKCTWAGCSYAAARKQILDTHYRKHTGEYATALAILSSQYAGKLANFHS